MVLAEGAAADGPLVECDAFGVDEGGSYAEVVAAAIQGTRESAQKQGHYLNRIAVACSSECEIGTVRAILDDRQLFDVALVDVCHAAAALTRAVGHRKALSTAGLLLIDDSSAAIVVVDNASVTHVAAEAISAGGEIDAMTALVAETAGLPAAPEELILVDCSTTDTAETVARLRTLTAAAVAAPADPLWALARGAALTCAATSAAGDPTAALAYSQAVAEAASQAVAEVAGSDAQGGAESIHDDVMVTGAPAAAFNLTMLPLGSVLAALSIAAATVLGITLTAKISPSADKHANEPMSAAAPPHVTPSPPQPITASPAAQTPPVAARKPPSVDYQDAPTPQVAAPRLVAAAQPQPTVTAAPTPTASPRAAQTSEPSRPPALAQTAIGQSASTPAADSPVPVSSPPPMSPTPVLGGQDLWQSQPAAPPWLLVLPRLFAPPMRSTSGWMPQYPY
ncbi:hypothetical protein H7J51_00075 [Mycobacterium crocinum]|uniref:DUF7159 domain-containing protein n=1 Tax=Mycolicibacterium crocinum TaxID=388459 RepID=A0ABY3TCZ5_9MYCO|nr:hypothetical protein [Mycolicibacterium crocinum]MCV7213681.1 hypothetical protein [Mycolicibacterium crocinum]ULN39236.1 hypothetical protein MI149_15780 [Mycolicibacterium crocinum]